MIKPEAKLGDKNKLFSQLNNYTILSKINKYKYFVVVLKIIIFQFFKFLRNNY